MAHCLAPKLRQWQGKENRTKQGGFRRRLTKVKVQNKPNHDYEKANATARALVQLYIRSAMTCGILVGQNTILVGHQWHDTSYARLNKKPLEK